MRMTFVKGIVAGGAVAVGALASASALAGTGIGGVFNLGQTNTVNAKSMLSGATAGPQLQVTNTSTGTGATGLGINVAAGKPPLTVNSTTQVPQLNASLLGGKAASAFLGANGTATNAAKLGGIAPVGYVHGTGTVTGTMGFLALDAPNQIYLGPVGSLGTLWGRCEDQAAYSSGVWLVVDKAVPYKGALVAYEDRSDYFGPYGTVLALGGLDVFKQLGTNNPAQNLGGDFTTLQISYGNEVDTVTMAALDYNHNGSDHCDFSAQVVKTTG